MNRLRSALLPALVLLLTLLAGGYLWWQFEYTNDHAEQRARPFVAFERLDANNTAIEGTGSVWRSPSARWN